MKKYKKSIFIYYIVNKKMNDISKKNTNLIFINHNNKSNNI